MLHNSWGKPPNLAQQSLMSVIYIYPKGLAHSDIVLKIGQYHLDILYLIRLADAEL